MANISAPVTIEDRPIFTVKHKETGLFFGGFDADQSPIWCGIAGAKRMTKSSARGQALLFRSFDIAAQTKPVEAPTIKH